MHMLPEAVYVLNRRPYKETSLILEVFSPNYGRLNIIANGALKSKKGWSAMLQVFQPLLLSWTGRSSLKTLTAVETPSAAIELSGDRLFSAYYLNELLLKLIPCDEGGASSFNNIECFLSYSKTLDDLCSYEDIEIPLRRFEYQLLAELGVFPDISSDINGSEISANVMYQLIPQEGFQVTTISSPRLLLNGTHLQELNHLLEDDFVFSKSFLKQIKGLMRTLITELLGGQELKSRALFTTYQPFRRVK